MGILSNFKFSAWFVLLLITSSCIREDLSDCPVKMEKLQVAFSFDTPAGPRNIDPAELKIAHLYIFDVDGNYVSTVTYQNPQLYHNYPIEVDLLPGEYEFIVWMNTAEYFDVLSVDSNEKLSNPNRHEDIIKLAVPSLGYITSEIPLIMFGEVSNQQITNDNQIITIPLVQNTNTINVTVKGLPQTGHEYYQVISDNNAYESLQNKPVAGEEISYVAPMNLKGTKSVVNESTDLVSSLRVLKLYKENQPKLVLWNETEKIDLYPGKSGLSNDLIKMITEKYPDVDFKTTHVFDIILYYNTNMEVTVDIQYWNDYETDYTIEPD